MADKSGLDSAEDSKGGEQGFDVTIGALSRAISKLHPRPRKANRLLVDCSSTNPVTASLDDEILCVQVENTSTAKVDVYLGAQAGTGATPLFSVDAGYAKQVPLTSSGSAAVTIVPRTVGTGLARVLVSNVDHGYFVGAVTL